MAKRSTSFWLGIVICLFATLNVRSQTLSGFDFLRLEPSAEAAALGGTLLNAASSQSSAILYNPALLSREAEGSLTVSWLNHLSDLQSGTVTYARDLGGLGMAGVGVRFFHWGKIDQADANGERIGTLASSNVALSAGLSRPWHSRFRYGASFHLAYSSIGEFNAVAVAMDAGLVYYVPDQGLTASIGATNVGRSLSSLGQSRDAMPVDLRMAVSKRLRYIPVLVGLTVYNLQHIHEITTVNEGFRHAIFSLEFQAIPAFDLRLGYNHRKRNLKSDRRLDMAGTTVGFGLQIRRFELDYSFSSWSFAGLHQFTVTTRFNKRNQ
ncbi:MAG: type IX secretion system protein PorQ [Bacteroidetes bacterium]|nr:type IX secretion system protein PorQ [Bacteroidota bacterium]